MMFYAGIALAIARIRFGSSLSLYRENTRRTNDHMVDIETTCREILIHPEAIREQLVEFLTNGDFSLVTKRQAVDLHGNLTQDLHRNLTHLDGPDYGPV